MIQYDTYLLLFVLCYDTIHSSLETSLYCCIIARVTNDDDNHPPTTSRFVYVSMIQSQYIKRRKGNKLQTDTTINAAINHVIALIESKD